MLVLVAKAGRVSSLCLQEYKTGVFGQSHSHVAVTHSVSQLVERLAAVLRVEPHMCSTGELRQPKVIAHLVYLMALLVVFS